jgi:hypothetical protein
MNRHENKLKKQKNFLICIYLRKMLLGCFSLLPVKPFPRRAHAFFSLQLKFNPAFRGRFDLRSEKQVLQKTGLSALGLKGTSAFLPHPSHLISNILSLVV